MVPKSNATYLIMVFHHISVFIMGCNVLRKVMHWSRFRVHWTLSSWSWHYRDLLFSGVLAHVLFGFSKPSGKWPWERQHVSDSFSCIEYGWIRFSYLYVICLFFTYMLFLTPFLLLDFVDLMLTLETYAS